MAAVVPNFEEAANVASEFIYSIDNLPSEVAHILQEIKHRDWRTIELQQEIDKDASRYIRHSRRASSASAPMPMTTMSSTSVPDSPSGLSSRADSIGPGGGTPISIPTKITACYTEMHELAAEKVALAEKLVELITRTRAKLDVDISKVRLLQGEAPELVAAQASASMNLKPAGMIGYTGINAGGVGQGANGVAGVESFGAPGRNPALAISESLRNAMATPPLTEGRNGVATSVSAVGSPGVHANKKRRTTTTTSIKISPAPSPTKRRSASPASVTPAHGHTQHKSRLSRQVHPPPVDEDDDDDMEVDGEGEDEDAEVEDDNDETLYCFCQKQSYGDMIACDNEGKCPYEWFHLACVGLKQPPAEKWYCSVCAKDKGLSTTTTTTRKGRKK